MTREVFEAGQGRLKVVGRAGVGIDNVDLQAATEVSEKLSSLTGMPDAYMPDDTCYQSIRARFHD